MCLATKFDAVSCLLWSDDFSYLKKKKRSKTVRIIPKVTLCLEVFLVEFFFFITEFENMKESTMVLWVFFFWGGGSPR